jgi:hypothetical protein
MPVVPAPVVLEVCVRPLRVDAERHRGDDDTERDLRAAGEADDAGAVAPRPVDAAGDAVDDA